MKKFFVLLLMISIFSIVLSQENWKAYTSTNYIFSIDKYKNNIAIATWGGVQLFDDNSKTFGKTITTLNGLSSNFIKDVKYNSQDNTLYLATKNNGVDRIKNSEIILPMSNILGLISDNVNKIVIKDSLIFVATKNGLSVFYNNSENSFPVLVKNFSNSNGLSSNDITSLFVTDSFIYCGSANGLDYLAIDSVYVAHNAWKHLNVDNSPLPDNRINDIYCDNDFLALATRDGLVCIAKPENYLSWKVYERGKSIFPVYIKDNKVYFSYGFWDGDKMAIIKRKSEKYMFSVIENPLSDANFTIYSTDKLSENIMGFKIFDSGLYVYTWGDGLYYSSDLQNWMNYMPNCPIANNVFRVKMDKSNKIWLATGHHDPYPSATGTKGVSSFDGNVWKNYSFENSPLTSNNIISIGVDENNNVWFGSRWNPGDSEVDWDNAISIYKQNEDIWDTLYVSDNFVMDMYFDEEKHQKWLTFYDRGVTILDENNDVYYSFEIYGSADQKVVKTLPAMNKVFFGFWFDGIKYWNSPSLPGSDEKIYDNAGENSVKGSLGNENWITPPATQLTTGKIYDIAYRVSKFGEEQVWFASANGLFMFNGTNWYWYGPIQKKRILAASYNWEPDNIDQPEYHTPEFWYVVGQERLYSSGITYPMALFVDPFGSIWIGTHDQGITRFYPDDDIYINYKKENYPLLSNSINDFAYDADSGTLYIATSEGLNSVYIGIAEDKNTVKKLNNTIVYPNPFSPYNGQILKIRNTNETSMPKGKTYCKIYDLNGNEIIKLQKNDYQQFEWNGKNHAGKYCAPGIYFYVVYTPDGQIDRNKFVIVR